MRDRGNNCIPDSSSVGEGGGRKKGAKGAGELNIFRSSVSVGGECMTEIDATWRA